MAAKPYAPLAFLRSVPNKLLQEFFAKREELLDFPWEQQKKEVAVQLIHDAWSELPVEKAHEVEGIFQDVYEVAHEPGIKTLIEEGNYHELDFATPLSKMDGFEEQALWVYIHHRERFEVAARFNHADSLSRRSWRTRGGFPSAQPRIDPVAKDELAAKIAEHFQKESRGKHCVVENWWRAKKAQYFFAYPEDFARIDDSYDAKGKFRRQVHKPVFEVIYRHDPETGVLSVYATGTKQLIERLQTIFCEVMWNIDLPPMPPKSHPYELNEILKRNFRFETNPADHIDRVGIRRLRLSVTRDGDDTRRITLETGAEADPDDMPEMYRDFLDHEHLKNEVVNVTQATFEFEFKPCELTKNKHKIVSFELTFPDKGNLGTHQDAFRTVIEKYLRKWKIYRVAIPAVPMAADPAE